MARQKTKLQSSVAKVVGGANPPFLPSFLSSSFMFKAILNALRNNDASFHCVQHPLRFWYRRVFRGHFGSEQKSWAEGDRRSRVFTSTTSGFSSEIGTKLRNWAVGQAGGSCYSRAALSSNDSNTRQHGSRGPYLKIITQGGCNPPDSG